MGEHDHEHNADCCVEECSCIETDDQHVYRYRPVDGCSVSFSVKCANDAHLCLSPADHDSQPMLQVFIGGWHNQKSGLRLNTDQDVARVETPDIVSADAYRRFWISWHLGIIQVGREGEEEPFMSWQNPDPFEVNFVGYTTGWGACGSWKFHDESLFETHDGCDYHFRPIHGTSMTVQVQAPNDAHIALTAGPEKMPPFYEIFIGGWNNQKCAIRYVKAVMMDEVFSDDVASADTPDVLSGDEMREFTLTWMNGDIRVYSGKPSPGAEPIMAWVDPTAIRVTHFGFKSAWGADGKWRFEV